jgi:drug/metabolite transporter (DMT)-like permease
MLLQIILLIIANAISAVTYPIGKLTFQYGSPLFLTGVRMLLGGVLLVVYAHVINKQSPQSAWNKKFLLLLLGLSFLNIFFTNLLQFWALNYLSAGKAIFIFNTAPFISAVLSYFLYNEKMTTKKVIALGIAFIGFLPIILSSSGIAQPHAQNIPYGLPEIALVIGAIASVCGWLVMKKILQVSPISVPMINGLSMLIGGIFFFPASYFIEGPQWNTVTNIPYLSLLIFILIIANNVVAYNCYGYFLKYLSATLLFLVSFTNPLFAVIFGWLFLGEPIGISFLITSVIVSIGLWMYYQEEERLAEQPQI